MSKARSTSNPFDMFDVLRQNYRCQSQLNDQLQRIVKERSRASERLSQQREAVRRELLESLACLHVYKRYSFRSLQAQAEEAAAAAAAAQRSKGGPSTAPPPTLRCRPNVLLPLPRLSNESARDPFHIKDILKDIHRHDGYAFYEAVRRKAAPPGTAAAEAATVGGGGGLAPAARTKRVPTALKFPAIWKSRDKTFFEKKKEKLLTEWTSPAAVAAAAARHETNRQHQLAALPPPDDERSSHAASEPLPAPT